jgi:AraC-like DNA-binding protein
MLKHFRVAASLAAKLEESGVRVPAVLRHAGLPPDLFQQTRILLTTEELFALWRSIGEVSNDPAIGLKLGTETRLDRFHPVSLAALATESFGAAIEHMARYKRLCAPEEILHQSANEEWSIQFRWTLAAEAEPQVLMDLCFAWVLTIARHGSGTRLTPLRVEFVQSRTILKTLERHFGCPVFCGASRNAIIFRAADSQCPFVTRNLELLDMLAPQLEEQLNQHKRAQDNFIEQVRGTIQQKLTGHRPTTEDVARALHLSSRTLQRRLQESGSSFQQLLDEARHQMARYYLSNSVLELNEAAYLLGYEDANSFARAFRSWEGVPPSHWREAHRGAAVN